MYCMIITTCANEEDAKAIIGALLADRLAACIQLFPIRSHYVWQGRVNEDAEVILLIKTKANLFDKIEDCIRRHHKYEIPEIIQLPIAKGSQSYFQWIDEVTG